MLNIVNIFTSVGQKKFAVKKVSYTFKLRILVALLNLLLRVGNCRKQYNK